MRMQWRLPQWKDYSILQIRVIHGGEDKSILVIHQEKLADESKRLEMKQYWKQKMVGIIKDLDTYYSPN